MMSTWMSFKITQVSLVPGPFSQMMLPNTTPVSVLDTLIVAFTLWKACAPRVCVPRRSTSLRSPNVANSMHRFCSVCGV